MEKDSIFAAELFSKMEPEMQDLILAYMRQMIRGHNFGEEVLK